MAKKSTGKSVGKKFGAKKVVPGKVAKAAKLSGNAPGKSASLISLTDSQKESVLAIQERILKGETNFRELSRVESNAQLAKLQVLTSLQKDEAIRKDTVNNLAESYGIDVNDPSKGSWNFNIESGTFTMTETK